MAHNETTYENVLHRMANKLSSQFEFGTQLWFASFCSTCYGICCCAFSATIVFDATAAVAVAAVAVAPSSERWCVTSQSWSTVYA